MRAQLTEGRSGARSILVGGGLIALGLFFLVGHFVVVDLEVPWPLFILVPGLFLLLLAVILRARSGEWLAVPGSMTVMAGLLLLYQDATEHWESWAYAWALICPAAAGAGLVLYGWLTRSRGSIAVGLRLSAIGVALFVVGAVFFEGVIGVSGRDFGPIGRIGLPAVLIAFGLVVLLADTVRGRRRTS